MEFAKLLLFDFLVCTQVFLRAVAPRPMRGVLPDLLPDSLTLMASAAERNLQQPALLLPGLSVLPLPAQLRAA